MSNQSPSPPLTALKLIEASWTFLMGHARFFATVAAFPLTLALSIATLALMATDAGAPETLVSSAKLLLGVLPWALFGVAWHRLILSAEEASVVTTWSRSHTHFALYILAWRAPFLVVAIPEAGSRFLVLFFLAFFAAAIVLSYLQARLSLFLPATAIGRPIALREAWAHSRGYGGALFWAGALSGLLGALVCFPLGAIAWYLQQSSSSVAQLVAVALDSATFLVVEALAVGALSFAYRAILTQSETSAWND